MRPQQNVFLPKEICNHYLKRKQVSPAFFSTLKLIASIHLTTVSSLEVCGNKLFVLCNIRLITFIIYKSYLYYV